MKDAPGNEKMARDIQARIDRLPKPKTHRPTRDRADVAQRADSLELQLEKHRKRMQDELAELEQKAQDQEEGFQNQEAEMERQHLLNKSHRTSSDQGIPNERNVAKSNNKQQN